MLSDLGKCTHVHPGFRCGVMPCDPRELITALDSKSLYSNAQCSQSFVVRLLDIGACSQQLADDVLMPCACCGTLAGVRNCRKLLLDACGLNKQCGEPSNQHCPAHRLLPSDPTGNEQSPGPQRSPPNGEVCGHPIRHQLSELRQIYDNILLTTSFALSRFGS